MNEQEKETLEQQQARELAEERIHEKASEEYTADQSQVLEGLEAVR